jgi:large subunit ribosomal protein L43
LQQYFQTKIIIIIMATRGVVQLLKLQLFYCEHGGSSRAMRDFISSGRLVDWATRHPQTQIQVSVRNGQHPYVAGEYLTSPDNVQHQISVKNFESWRDVQQVCQQLANRSGRKITKITRPVLTDTPSIQGVWTPFLNLQELPPIPVTMVQFPSPPSLE